MSRLILQQGELLAIERVHRNAAGVPINLTTAGITVTATVKTLDGASSFPLVVTIRDQAVTPGGYGLEADSTTWPIGELVIHTNFDRPGFAPYNHMQYFDLAAPTSATSDNVPTPYVHLQTVAAAEWIVNHNLGRKPAGVDVLSTGGTSVIAEIVHMNGNQLRVFFAAPAMGSVNVL